MPGRALRRRDAERRIVAGTPEAATRDENFRYVFATVEEARGYVDSAGLEELPEAWAIEAVPSRRVQREGRRVQYRVQRPALSHLSKAQQRRYLGSRQAREEAEAHGMTIREWYRRAPDLKAFRGHAPERRRRVGESIEDYAERLGLLAPFEYAVYISRNYEHTGSQSERRRERATSRRVKRIAAQRRARREGQNGGTAAARGRGGRPAKT